MVLKFLSMRIRQPSSRMPLRINLECLNFLTSSLTSDLIQPVANLEGLVVPFQHNEVDIIFKELKTGKSPGPDGFNSDFMKNVGLLSKMIFMTYALPSLITIYACKVSMAHISLSSLRWTI
jgi:hypothetical protein